MDNYTWTHVAPRLQKNFWRVAKTPSGRRVAEASRRKGVRYMVSRIPGGLTLNVIRHVFINESHLNIRDEKERERALADIIAHEGSHVAQGFLSDSLKQEARAFKTAAVVLGELGCKDKDIEGWTTCNLEEATKRVLELYPNHPLYRQLPKDQKEGLEDVIEMIRQAAILLKPALNLFRQK